MSIRSTNETSARQSPVDRSRTETTRSGAWARDLVLIGAIAFAAASAFGGSRNSLLLSTVVAATTMIAFAIVSYAEALYQPDPYLGSRSNNGDVVGALSVAGVAGALALTIGGVAMPSALAAGAITAATGVAVVAVGRVIATRSTPPIPHRVLLVGQPDDIEVTTGHLARHRTPVEIVATTNTMDNLDSLIETVHPTDVLLINPSSGEIGERWWRTNSVRFYRRLSADLARVARGGSRQIGSSGFVVVEQAPIPIARRRTKRVIDATAAVVTLPITVPVAIAAWIIGAISTRQLRPDLRPRVGRNGTPFTAVYLSVGPRMRRWKLDCAVQWIHVLSGSMSIVGPRHESIEATDRYRAIIPDYDDRLAIAPGAIGLAKNAGGFLTDPGAELDYDRYYLNNWSPLLDLQVAFRAAMELARPRSTVLARPTRLAPEAPGSSPTVAVALAARNEEPHLADAVASIVDQGYEGLTKIVIAVGPSDDGTAEVARTLAATDERIVVIDNPDGRAPHGFNRAAALCDTDYIALMNAHCEVSPDYFAIGLRAAERMGAANVGGRQHADGDTPWQQAIAGAVNSPIGVGGARHHYDVIASEIESVPLGIFRRRVFEDLGGFDEDLIRNEDYELNWRIRRHGMRVWFDPRLVVTYKPRAKLGGLAAQYWDYGRYKRRMLTRWPASIRWHYAVPPLAVMALAASLIAAVVWSPWFLMVPAAYVIGVSIATRLMTRLPDGRRGNLRSAMAAMVMHLCWGSGLLVGPRWDRRNRTRSP